jgi:small subunit ribosomal protein S17e
VIFLVTNKVLTVKYVGRIKTKLIKRKTNEFVKQHGDKLKDTYDHNKELVSKLVVVASPKLRNIIAGYATRLMKARK